MMRAKKTEEILRRFPKKRKRLPTAYQEIYASHYSSNRAGSSTASKNAQKLEKWMHKKVAALSSPELRCLELGAGNLNQLPYEKPPTTYDIVEPFDDLYAASPNLKRINTIYKSIEEIEKHKKYDRILSVAVLEHIEDLPKFIAKAAFHMKDKAVFQAAIPNEGTVLWKMGTLYTGREFKKKYGLDYQLLMQYEHLNTAKEIHHILHYFFKDIKIKLLGLSKSIAFYRYYECRELDREKIKSFLEYN